MSNPAHTFETPARVSVKLELGSADVEIGTSPRATTEIEIVPSGQDAAEFAASITVDARQLGDRTEIVVAEPRRSRRRFSKRSDTVTIFIRCPDGVDIDCSSGSSDLRGSGSLGELLVKSGSGDIKVDVVRGGCHVASASGDIDIESVEADAVLATASGDVTVREAHAGLSVNTVSGDVSVRAAHRGATSQTVSGDIELVSVGGGDIRLQSVSGDVTIGVAPGQVLWLDVASVSGDTRSDLDVGDDAGPGDGPEVELRVRTVSGDVQIRRQSRLESAL